jgi:proteasome assembly chaperone (PAC2) family protein
MHLTCEVLEEPLQLIEIAVRRRQELLRIHALGPHELLHIDLECVAEPLDPSTNPHRIARRKPRRHRIGIAKHPAGDRAGAITELQREVRLPGARDQPLRAHDGKRAIDELLLSELGDGRGSAGNAWRGATGVLIGRRRDHRGSCSVNDVKALRWDHRPEGLRGPALVCAFRGWSDAGQASTIGLAAIGRQLETEPFASYDPEHLYDFQASRPYIVVRNGVVRDLRWPRVEYRAARAPRAPRDLITLMGPEPSTQWGGFADSVAEVARDLGAQMIITLGSLMGDVPHTRPAPLMAIGSDESLLDRLDLHRPDYEGPTGLLGPIHIAAMRHNIPVVGLWASIPHYVSAPNPNGALSLVRGVEKLTGVSFDASALEEGSREFEERVNGAVANDPAVAQWVERLEEAAADEQQAEMADPEALPDGDLLAREFQRFLRQRGPEDE